MRCLTGAGGPEGGGQVITAKDGVDGVSRQVPELLDIPVRWPASAGGRQGARNIAAMAHQADTRRLLRAESVEFRSEYVSALHSFKRRRLQESNQVRSSRVKHRRKWGLRAACADVRDVRVERVELAVPNTLIVVDSCDSIKWPDVLLIDLIIARREPFLNIVRLIVTVTPNDDRRCAVWVHDRLVESERHFLLVLNDIGIDLP